MTAVQPDYLSDEFLHRVRAAYRRALAMVGETKGMWAGIDARRADVHAALMDESDDALREIFRNPTDTDLFYGVDNLCRSVSGPCDPQSFLDKAITNERAALAPYQAKRVAELLKEASGASVVEIGPGMGRVAYFARRLGITDYATIDLPLGVVAQACFLGRALGPSALWFEGEAEPTAPCVRLYWSRPERRFDVAVNVDSLTEMPSDLAFDYARWIGKRADTFLSINHRKNRFTVAELMAFAGAARGRGGRSCPWPDYEEEVYFCRQGRALPVSGFWLFANIIGRMRCRIRRHVAAL